MNVLFVEQNLCPSNGGVERVTYTLKKAFDRMGMHAYVAYVEKDDDCIDVQDKCHISGCRDKDYNILYEFIKAKNVRILICQNLHGLEYQPVYKKLKEVSAVKIITVLHCNPDMYVYKNRLGCTTLKVYIVAPLQLYN